MSFGASLSREAEGGGQPRSSRLFSYGVVVLSVAAAAGLRLLFWPLFGVALPFLFFFPAVMVSAWFGGLRCGLIATVLSSLICGLFFDPFLAPRMALWVDLVALLLFVLVSTFISILAGQLHRATRQAMAYSAELAQQSRWISATLTSIGDAVIATDLEGTIVFMNPIAEQLTGWTMAEAHGSLLEDVFRVVAEDTHAPAAKAFLHALREGAVEGLAHHTRLLSRDGRETPIGNRASPIRGSAGEIVGAVLVFHDTSQEKRAQEELARSRHLFERMALAIPDLLFVFDHLEKRVIYSNRKLGGILGYSLEEVEAFGDQILQRLVHPEDLPMVLEQNRRFETAPEGELLRSEARYVHKCGDIRWLDLREVTFTRAPDGRIHQGLGVIQDISDRKVQEEALRTHEARLRLALDAGRVGVWDWDISTNARVWSDRIYEMYGMTSEKGGVPQEDYDALTHPDDRERVREALTRALETREAYQIEFRAVGPDGGVRWLSTTGKVHRDSVGVPVRMIGATVDVTERKQAEAALKEADRRKDEFLAMLAHELRNPLAPIRNALHLIHMAEDPEEAVRRMYPVMERQLNQLVRLVDDLLDISRVTRGKIELRKERHTLADIVHSALETSQSLIVAAGLELTVTVSPSICIEGDFTRLAQVFSNLLNNAAKYSALTGGHIWLSGREEEGQAVVLVRDTGIGISQELIPSIFEMFTQVDRSNKRSQDGLGIGLTLVQRLVWLHGGTVTARSEGPGLGSEFEVRLPLASGTAPGKELSAPEPKAAEPSPVRRRILVVDDNQDSADTLSEMLTLSGYEVQTVYDGPTALQAAAAFAPQFVLLDIGLPGMNGHEVARALRMMPGLADAVLVAVTGWGQPQDREASRAAGFNHHLVKPLDFDVLMKMLEDAASPGG